MKVACDKCLTVKDAAFGLPKDWCSVKVSNSDFLLCPVCVDGVWMAVDNTLPPVVERKED